MRRFVAYMLAVLLTGCFLPGISSQVTTINASLIYSNSICNSFESAPAATFISDAEAYSRIYGRLRKHIIGIENDKAPEVDFTAENILLVEMGQRSTAGHEIGLAGNAVSVSNAIADVKISWIEPREVYVTAQVITSPCVIIKLPKGNYSHVRISDQNNKVRVELDVPVQGAADAKH
ncbi:MAG: protease complex subunit PrcB family protein [Nitrospirae bacterium]|nr:protease complex subunit PrcB family protein [Nitrospirota bacterium]